MSNFILKHILIPLILLAITTFPTQSQPTVIDQVVAVVGKEAILLSDLNARVEFYVFNNRLDPNTPGLRDQILEMMIDEKLIQIKAFDDTTITVTEDEITNQIDAIINQRIQQVGSEQRLEEIYGMSISRMKREFRDDMRKELYGQKLQQIRFGEIQCSRREIEEFFAQYKDSLPVVPEEVELFHIFKVPLISPEAKSRVIRKAQTILDSIKMGGDFADFAKRYSEDYGSAIQGGDLGFTRRGQFVKEFEEVVFALKEGQISDLIETSFGIHIIQLLERRGEAVRARHILFKIERSDSEKNSVIEFLKNLKDSVKNGKEFSELARLYSEDKDTGPLGGYLGQFRIDQLDRSIQVAIRDIPEGGISDPFEVSAGGITGYQIIYVKRRIPEHRMTLETDWRRIEQYATIYKRNKEFQEWVEQLRSEIFWEKKLFQ